jgi:two-component system, OmpR family, phosphate regulon response regulator PhoB
MSERTSGSRYTRRLLIVEDERDVREMLTEHFESLGCRVETATDGNDAIAKALKTPPDVIILEFELPHLDGWETMKVLASYPTTKKIPVVGCTVASDEGLRKARELGCRDIARKPCTLATVEAMVRNALHAGAPTASGAG